MVSPDDVVTVLEESRRLGFLGDREIGEVITHARRFVSALDDVRGEVVDLGSGGGVPGLVVAVDRPDLAVTLVDRRTKRTDFLERMVSRLDLGDRVTVRACDVEQLIADRPASFSAATARGFGPPMETLRSALDLVVAGGLVVISEPPSGDRWDTELVRSAGAMRRDGVVDGVATFERIG